MAKTPDGHPAVRIWCLACEGDGATLEERAAILDGRSQTVVTERVCRWCSGTGRRRFEPPV